MSFDVVDPVETAKMVIAVDREHDDPAIWISRLTDEAILTTARALHSEGPAGRPLWGVPFALKDNIDVAGLHTTAGCPAFSYVAEKDAPAVRRLIDAGALLIGKTNLDQFATGLVGTRSPYGTPRNVFDPLRVPGGSSSGSGCAVAAGIVPFAIGTDTAGSGRIPAAFGNIVGLKPTIGSVSSRGVVPACKSIDTISVFSRTVDEALIVQRIIAEYDPADAYSRRAPFPHLRKAALPPNVRVRVANLENLCDPAVAACVTRVASLLSAEPIDIAPFLEIARLLYDGPWVAERTAALLDFLQAHPESCHPVTRTILEGGLRCRTVDAFLAFHKLALARRFAAELFTECDALLLPTAPFCPFLDELAADPIGPNTRLGTFTNFVNLCDLAAIAVPAGFGPDALPIGVTLIGPAWSEGRLAQIADVIHRAFSNKVGATNDPLPPACGPDVLASDETALFCVGSHMSGLTLNGQIVGYGGRFLRAASTVENYRLYALGDRPGMLRGDGGGVIEGEVWAIPTTAIGALLALVPPQLGFGIVTLRDGPCLGFLAEAASVIGAKDITMFKGWRAWLDAGGGS